MDSPANSYRLIRHFVPLGAFILGLLVFAAPPAEAGGAQPARTVAQASSGSQNGKPLDFEVYRTRIEPIFLKVRAGGVRCVACHSVIPTRLQLQPLNPGATTWTEEQSRQNFQVVSQLVVPGEPMKSRLLLHPLAPEAGGDPSHTGGKFWKSTSDPEWQMIADWVRAASPAASSESAASSGPVLDYDFFKNSVEPIFLQKRPGLARCYACHENANNGFHLESLSPGATTWSDEQSRKNFNSVSQLVVPGEPLKSHLLLHPLAPEAGGDPFHSGGRQFLSQSDPDWQIMAEWVRGQKATTSAAH